MNEPLVLTALEPGAAGMEAGRRLSPASPLSPCCGAELRPRRHWTIDKVDNQQREAAFGPACSECLAFVEEAPR